MEQKLLERFSEIEPAVWELPKSFRKKMKVPVRIVATEELLKDMDDGAVEQAVNVAQLPGIINASLVMPDAHWGYGFPIGGVAAFDLKKGVISPGGIGFDINCGMRLLVTNLKEKDVRPKIETIVNELFKAIPAGVGHGGAVRLSVEELKEIMVGGAKWAIEKGLGWPEDIKHIEAEGQIEKADPNAVSDRAIKRGIDQLGTLGAGNHYLEVQKVETVFDEKVAESMSISGKGQITVMIHCGSRGFGHQIATDHLRIFEPAMKKYEIVVADQQLACVPFDSSEGRAYFSAMAAAANFAFCNRQVIAHKVREVFSSIFGKSATDLGMKLVYDVAHNIAKIEKFNFGTQNSKLKTQNFLVHRKGATRAYPNQPVIIGGSMETGSYLLVGTEGAMKKTFGSTAHGSGRTMSRTQAKKIVQGKELQEKMKAKGIYVKSVSYAGLAEEAGVAYKDINEVVKATSIADISQPVASLTPIGNIKG
jgi:tRNA-splicing ligase RtcB